MAALTGMIGALRAEKRSAQEVFDLGPHHVQSFGIDQVGLSDDGQATIDGEQAADLEVLAGLGFDGFISSHHQHHHVDAADPRQHVADETFVSGHVHQTQPQPVAVSAREIQVSETYINGDAATALFFEAVRVSPSQGLYQTGLSMVDVSGGADDNGLHFE